MQQCRQPELLTDWTNKNAQVTPNGPKPLERVVCAIKGPLCIAQGKPVADITHLKIFQILGMSVKDFY